MRGKAVATRINIHGAIDLETGQTRMIEALTIDAASTIRLLQSIEALYPMLALIHVFLDNARYHHAKLVQEWLALPGRRIKLHFIPTYCPHLNPIERLWGLMHRNVTHNKCYATCAQLKPAGEIGVGDDQRFGVFAGLWDERDSTLAGCTRPVCLAQVGIGGRRVHQGHGQYDRLLLQVLNGVDRRLVGLAGVLCPAHTAQQRTEVGHGGRQSPRADRPPTRSLPPSAMLEPRYRTP